MKKTSKFLVILIILCLAFASACAPQQETPTPDNPTVVEPTISQTQLTIVVGKNQTLTTNLQNATWSSSNTSVAKVENGVISALSVGNATIKATSESRWVSCSVTVVADSLTVSHKTVTLGEGSTFQLQATSASNSPITYSCNNKAVATVSESGLITGISKGSASVRISAGGLTQYCNVTVTSIVSKFEATTTKDKLAVGEQADITVTLKALNESTNAYENITSGFVFQSSDNNIATVDNDGVITAIAEGTAVFTVSHPDYRPTTTCSITVTKPLQEIENFVFDEPNVNLYGRIGKVTYQNKTAYQFVNTASAFELTFQGCELKVNMAVTGAFTTTYLYVIVDGIARKVAITTSNSYKQVTLVSGLKDEVHTLIAYKVHEEAQSIMYIEGVSGGTKYFEPPQKPQLKLEFYGDSITAGWSAAMASDMGNSFSTSDGTKTYAFVATQQLGAQLEVMCMSGISLAVPIWNYNNFIKDCYNKYNITSNQVWNFANPSDVIVINIGTNDGGAINKGNGTVDQFVLAYKTLIANLRKVNANAHIICVYGMMSDGEFVNTAIKNMVTDVNKTDAKVHSLQLGESSPGHPGSDTHYKAGTTLASFIEGLLK